ncbi:MAG: LptF/LptG family permease [Phycisphaerae bacterium]|nr:LptF/LptG family permease [Phycisphaerae bacterium]MDW8262347.1 LptF/LptG family permease [Phycisphaerales bacterium]
MGRTLFWYIFKDLLRIFFLTSGALAGIMSFAGLLRPLTQQGLDLSQVGEILGYFMPAMTTYSLPVAALFATTLVYGRLGADNEIIACRAAGISHLALTLPAFLLGVCVSLMSLLLLCFVVPALMMQAERVVFSNVARIVATAIDRTHQIQIDSGGERVTVFARDALTLPPDPDRPRDQAVQLIAPTIVTFGPRTREDGLRVPRDFWMAERATAYITPDEDSDELSMMAVLEGGTKFPRSTAGSTQGGIGYTRFGPIPFPSLVRENPRFMDIRRLFELLRDPGQSRRVRTVLREFIRAEQRMVFYRQIQEELNGSECLLSNETESYTLEAPGAAMRVEEGQFIAESPRGQRLVRLTQDRAGAAVFRVEARRLRLTALPDGARKLNYLTLELEDAIVRAGAGHESERAVFPRALAIAMSPELLALESRDARFYRNHPTVLPEQQKTLRRHVTVITNSMLGEAHARASFSLSCLILVLVGCALGMMFRSGNFMSAFAVSVVPALICIALIVTGQHTCENVPRELTAENNPLDLGLGLIWSGNIAVFLIAAVLLGRLQRQ